MPAFGEVPFLTKKRLTENQLLAVRLPFYECEFVLKFDNKSALKVLYNKLSDELPMPGNQNLNKCTATIFQFICIFSPLLSITFLILSPLWTIIATDIAHYPEFWQESLRRTQQAERPTRH